MSESEYYAEETQGRQKYKRTAAEALSDSEDDNNSVPKKTLLSKSAGTTSRKPSAAKKNKKLQAASSSGALKGGAAATAVNELFGEEWEEAPPQQQPLYSSLSRYLPTGTVRTSQVLDGEFFIELRVFQTDSIKNLPYNKRFEEVQAVLRLQLSSADPQWALVKKIFKEGKKKFEKEDVFYAKEKK